MRWKPLSDTALFGDFSWRSGGFCDVTPGRPADMIRCHSINIKEEFHFMRNKSFARILLAVLLAAMLVTALPFGAAAEPTGVPYENGYYTEADTAAGGIADEASGGNILDVVAIPFAVVLRFFFDLVNDYGIALILFTIVLRLALSPFAIKQQKIMLRNLKFKPRLDEINAKYGNDRARKQQEMAKLQSEGFSLMGGCGTQLIQMPLLIIVFQVVNRPLTHTLGWATERVNALIALLSGAFPDQAFNTAQQIRLIEYNNLYYAEEAAQQIHLRFLGMDLAQTFSSAPVLAIVIAVLSAATAYMLSRVTRKLNPMTVAMEQPGKGPGMMFMLMPLFSGVMALLFPLGLAIYWVMTNVAMIAQAYIINHFYSPEAKLAEMQAEIEAAKQAKKDKKKKKYLHNQASDTKKISSPAKKTPSPSSSTSSSKPNSKSTECSGCGVIYAAGDDQCPYCGGK